MKLPKIHLFELLDFKPKEVRLLIVKSKKED